MTDPNEKLEPCPFCGDPMTVSHNILQHSKYVETCPFNELAWAATEERLDAWNTRPTPDSGLVDDIIQHRKHTVKDGIGWYSVSAKMWERILTALQGDAAIRDKKEQSK